MPVKEGLWLTHSPLGLCSERAGRLEGPALRKRGILTVSSAQLCDRAEKAASDLPFQPGTCGAPRTLTSRQNGSFKESVTGTEFGYHCLSYKSCSWKRKCSHLILFHTDLKGEAGLKSIESQNESSCGEKSMKYSTMGSWALQAVIYAVFCL